MQTHRFVAAIGFGLVFLDSLIAADPAAKNPVAAKDEPGWASLFNGKDLSGWKKHRQAFWRTPD